jgi:hypothetical protein
MNKLSQVSDTQDSKAVLDQEDRLQAFGSTLSKLRDEWIRARSATGWDKRVAKDLDNYHMRDAATKMASSMMDSVQQGYPVTVGHAAPTRSTVFVGITRQKANAAEARLADIMLPTDDRNWGIQPTPDPEGARALDDDGKLIDPATGQPVLLDADGNVTTDPSQGQPVLKSQVAQMAQEVAKRAAKAMQDKIDDQLVECDFNAECRKMIHNAAVMGTGVIKGPIVTKRTRKAWRERKDASGASAYVLEIVEEINPASFSIDPRMVWEDPECGDDVQDGQGIFELERKTEKRVRDLAKQPGYLLDQLRKVLVEGPKDNVALNFELQRQDADKNGAERDRTYYHWYYWGELKSEDLVAAGVDLPPGASEDDPLTSVSGCVEMINDTVVRAYLNPLEDGALPYDFYPWEKVFGSPRGYGVPYLMLAQQSVTNAAWRQMMDNNGLTAGPQILVNQRAVTPADRQWNLRPFKFWYLNDENVDPARVFYSVEFANHQEQLAAVLDLSEKLADQETSVPMMAQGQQGSAPQTVGGMQLLMNSANVVLRRLVKQFDDYVTKPHIRRYYDYNMAYSDDDEIKGDFQIDARGSSALVVRDIQNQGYLNLLAAGANPIYSMFIDPKKLFEKGLQANYIDPKDIMLSDAQIEQKQQQPAPPDPRVQAAQISAQAKVQEAQAIAQGQAVEVQSREQAAVQDRQLRMQELQLQYEVEVLKTASALKISIEQVKAQLAQAAIVSNSKRELAVTKIIADAHGRAADHSAAAAARAPAAIPNQ